MVRDEADIIESTVRQMATQVDFLIVADNRSVDGTREILKSLAIELPLELVDDPQRGHYQGQTITALAERAVELGADWIVPFDADEWYYSPLGRIGDVLAERPEAIAVAVSYNHTATAEDDFDQLDPVVRIGWRERKPFPLPKVACRALSGLTIYEGNHFVDYGRTVGRVGGQLVIRHFQYRSPEQFERKVRNTTSAYAASALTTPLGDHLRRYGAILKEHGPAALERVFYECHYRENPRREVVVAGEMRPPLVFDPVRCRR